MKKLLFSIAAACLFIACEGPVGPMGPQGQDGRDGRDGQNGRDGQGTNWYTTSITIDADEWRLSGNTGELNSCFYANVELDQLTENVYRNGSVIAYIQTGDGVKNGMPFVQHRGAVEDGKEFLWTQTYDFDFIPGEIGFYVTYSDFKTEIRPGTETFHVILFWQ